MACWSAENATKAYLKSLKLGRKANEPDVVEFVSALAAGNNAQLMVVACSGAADYTTLALVAAAQQTGGRVVCILRGNEELHMSEKVLGVTNLRHIDFVIGEAQSLVLNYYKEADFVVIDCNLENHEGILRAVQMGKKQNGAVVVGANAFTKGSWRSGGAKTQLLPIGGGLLVTRIAASTTERRKSQWVVKVDKCTGEEHVFRVRFPHGKGIQA
ncbi:PREDICTED: uncharacterized protein LOC101292941 [Fragaria vesca subsp. vesca]|uniref:uncharacterized protein LOC101292941 n=1 Tax=Fragaria vesca subsp. vesca TaxID=101020 RepID=UPI0002C30042|nr:PREDICTED: uncharacterized protein LOC101292941 [Fragaria vesca subsp. vesca]